MVSKASRPEPQAQDSQEAIEPGSKGTFVKGAGNGPPLPFATRMELGARVRGARCSLAQQAVQPWVKLQRLLQMTIPHSKSAASIQPLSCISRVSEEPKAACLPRTWSLWMRGQRSSGCSESYMNSFRTNPAYLVSRVLSGTQLQF